MNAMQSLYRHCWAGSREAKRCFPDSVLTHIEEAVDESEKHHRGELCVVVEGGLGWSLHRQVSSRLRAESLFSQLGVWDTEENSGVLVYVLMADHKLEILADRGINAKVDANTWQKIADATMDRFKRGEYEAGLMAAIQSITDLLVAHFPAQDLNPNEIGNRPIRF